MKSEYVVVGDSVVLSPLVLEVGEEEIALVVVLTELSAVELDSGTVVAEEVL